VTAQRAPETGKKANARPEKSRGLSRKPGGKPRAPFEAQFSSDCHILRVGTVE